jgi:hypothetical protein
MGTESTPNPDQQFLIKLDLRPLRDWILNRLSGRHQRWQDLHAAVRPEWWLPKQVYELVRELKKKAPSRQTRSAAEGSARGQTPC